MEDFYAEHQGTEYYDSLIDNMVSGPVLALGLARDDAVKVRLSPLPWVSGPGRADQEP